MRTLQHRTPPGTSSAGPTRFAPDRRSTMCPMAEHRIIGPRADGSQMWHPYNRAPIQASRKWNRSPTWDASVSCTVSSQ
jgi:hypothetical protein